MNPFTSSEDMMIFWQILFLIFFYGATLLVCGGKYDMKWVMYSEQINVLIVNYIAFANVLD